MIEADGWETVYQTRPVHSRCLKCGVTVIREGSLFCSAKCRKEWRQLSDAQTACAERLITAEMQEEFLTKPMGQVG